MGAKLRVLALALGCMTMAAWGGEAPAAANTGLLSEAGPTFTIAAPQGAWTLIAYGDMRFTDPANVKVTDPVARRALVAKIAEEKPDALLLSGDVPYSGAEANDYAVYREETAAWRAAGLHVYPAMGNHELHGGDSLQNWWNAFPELKGRRWYSVRFGEAYFLTLDSNLDLTAGSAQSAWLAKQMEGLPKGTKYVFVSLHHPPMADPIQGNSSHNVRPNESALAKQLEAAAKQTAAKIVVIAGHIHAYQRFERNGVVYLVSGGGGAKQHLIERSPSDLYQDNVFPNFHYIKFVNKDGMLKATMYRLDEKGGFEARDSFVVGAAKK
jgi:3',5'-cyclic AMP phosphodiesterase CpdA